MERLQMDDRNTYKIGLISVLCCNTFWGFLPIYWQALKPIDSAVIIFTESHWLLRLFLPVHFCTKYKGTV